MRGFLAAACAVALLAAGCGSSGGGSTASLASADETATLAPRDAGLWIALDTSGTSSQWKALDAVTARIPGAEQLVDKALANVGSGSQKLDFRTDVQPALGPQVVVVLPAGAAQPLLLAKPTDKAKLEKLLADSTTPHVEGEHDGWTVVAETQKALDAYTAALGQGTLADSDAFAEAMKGLPSDTLARAYADGAGLGGVATGTAAKNALGKVSIPGVLPGTQATSVDPKALAKLGTVGLAVSSGDKTVRVDGSWRATATTAKPTEYKPTLLQRVPGDALAAVSFGGGAAAVEQARAALAETGSGQLDQVRQTLGVSVDDLFGLASGEGVLYVRPGLLLPEVTVVLQPTDPAGALRTIDTAVTKLASSSGAKTTETTAAGLHWKAITVSVLTLAWARDGDRVVVSTAPQGYSAFTGDGDKLVDTAAFKTAASDVGLGNTTSGVSYVDVNGLAPLLKTIANGLGSAPDPTVDKLVASLEGIDTVAFNATADGDTTRFQGVLRAA